MNLSSLQGSLWGQFVGDAASLGTHWIYDLEVMAAKYPQGINGFEAPKEGHYHFGKTSGDLTHYGDAALLMLESVAACGQFREADFGTRFEGWFRSPRCNSYLDHATKETLEHLREKPGDYQNGADDDQGATLTRLAPVVVAHLNQPDAAFFDAVRRATLVVQNHPTALACATASADLLRLLLNGTSFRAAYVMTRTSPQVTCEVADYIELAHELLHLDVPLATEKIGKSCPLAQSFPAALHAALRYSDDFQGAILATISAGGDSAARASMIGAWLGASLGMEGIPQEWLDRLRQKERIAQAIDQLLARISAVPG